MEKVAKLSDHFKKAVDEVLYYASEHSIPLMTFTAAALTTYSAGTVGFNQDFSWDAVRAVLIVANQGPQ